MRKSAERAFPCIWVRPLRALQLQRACLNRLIPKHCTPAAAAVFRLHIFVSAMEREREYCDAVFELLLSDPEQSMDLATLGRHIAKPSKKASSRAVLAADPRFNVAGTVVTLADGTEADYDDDDDDSEVSTSDSSLRLIGRLPPPRNAVERAYAAKINAAKRLPSCMLPSPQLLREWPHACIGPRGCPPLFPGPPLWLSDIQALSAALPTRAAAGLKFAAQLYQDQVHNDEAHLSLRNHSCETCKSPSCAPRCICGEAYCSRQCQLADWNKNHSAACEFVRTQVFHIGLLYTALYWKHQHGVAVSDGAFAMCGGEAVDAVEEKAFKPPSALAGGSVKRDAKQQQQQPRSTPASHPSPPALPPCPNPATFPRGAAVRIGGLKSRADLNGCLGTVLGEMDSSSQRWPVTVIKSSEQGREDVMVLAANLTIVAHADAVADDDDAALQNGCAVRILGLTKRPELNGRTGVCSAFNEESGRWMVVIDEEGSNVSCQVALRPSNLLRMTSASGTGEDIARLAAQLPAALRSSFSALQSLNLHEGSKVAKENVDTDWAAVRKNVSDKCKVGCIVRSTNQIYESAYCTAALFEEIFLSV